MYGTGAMPRIDGGGKTQVMLVRGVEFWEVRNLEVTNPGRSASRIASGSASWRKAGRPCGASAGEPHRARRQRRLRKQRKGCGIFFELRGRGSHFEGFVVERCHVYKTDRNGMSSAAAFGSRSTGVVVRENLLEDIGGDGIKVWGCDDAVIERNVLRGGRQRCDDAAAGIWPFDSIRTIVQYNEVSGMRGTHDGQAFDADFRCRGTTLQYNYSHDNEGGFLLVCARQGRTARTRSCGTTSARTTASTRSA